MSLIPDNLRPLLAPTEPIKVETLPVSEDNPYWVSPKLDGVRCLAAGGKALSRTKKEFPNRYVREMFKRLDLHGLDGELVVGSATHPRCIHNTTSGIMSIEGEPDFAFYVFDCWHLPGLGFRDRYRSIKRRVAQLQQTGFPIFLVPQVLCTTVAQIEAVIGAAYEAGYEGGMVRKFNTVYKFNRATRKEEHLMKVKESIDFEVEILGFVEMEHNNNEAKISELGLTKRSTHQANKVKAGTLGKMTGRRLDTGEMVSVGTGKMTAADKLEVWLNQPKYLHRISKSRAAAHGTKDLPRHPRHIVWRDPIDM